MTDTFSEQDGYYPKTIYDYIIRKYVVTIWSENKYIFSHKIVHWVYNYMFRPCILTIVRLYCKLNKQVYNVCVGYATHK